MLSRQRDAVGAGHPQQGRDLGVLVQDRFCRGDTARPAIDDFQGRWPDPLGTRPSRAPRSVKNLKPPNTSAQ